MLYRTGNAGKWAHHHLEGGEIVSTHSDTPPDCPAFHTLDPVTWECIPPGIGGVFLPRRDELPPRGDGGAGAQYAEARARRAQEKAKKRAYQRWVRWSLTQARPKAVPGGWRPGARSWRPSTGFLRGSSAPAMDSPVNRYVSAIGYCAGALGAATAGRQTSDTWVKAGAYWGALLLGGAAIMALNPRSGQESS